MYGYRQDLPKLELNQSQTVCFHHRMDRLKSFLNQYLILEARLVQHERDFVHHQDFCARTDKISKVLAISLPFAFSVIMFSADWKSLLSNDFNRLFIFSLLVIIYLFWSLHADLEKYLTTRAQPIERLKLDLQLIECDWKATSGGLSLQTYKTDRVQIADYWIPPDSDPKLKDLMRSVAEACTREVHYQVDPETSRIVSVMASL